MDHLKKWTQALGKYRWAVLILLIGVVLMLIPSGSTLKQTQQMQESEPTADDMEQRLTDILSKVHGVGKVQVMLTLEAGETTVYRMDEDGTVIVTDQDRAQSGLVERVEAQKYRGAVVVCQGADSPSVRLNIVQAVAGVTGLSSDRIVVMKMK